MAKKKIGQQLDLFGAMFANETVPAENNDVQLPVINEQELAEPEVTYTTQEEKQTTYTAENNNLVFADDKIGIKIKLKSNITPAAIPSTIPETTATLHEIIIEEPIVFEEPVADAVTKSISSPIEKRKLKTVSKKAKVKPINQSKRGRKSFKEMDDEIGLVNIPDDEILNKKLYYPIREVAAFFSVNTSLIRAWETEFDILKPRKNRKGDRLFRVEDIKNLQIIYYLLRNKKYSVDGAKKYLKENKSKADINQQLQQALLKFRSFLLELKTNLHS